MELRLADRLRVAVDQRPVSLGFEGEVLLSPGERLLHTPSDVLAVERAMEIEVAQVPGPLDELARLRLLEPLDPFSWPPPRLGAGEGVFGLRHVF